MSATMTAPELSLSQRLSALERANDIRSRRAQLKRDIKSRRKCALDIICEPPEYTKTMKVIELMLAMPKYGRVKVNKILNHCRISPSKTLGGLSLRQRGELAGHMRRKNF